MKKRQEKLPVLVNKTGYPVRIVPSLWWDPTTEYTDEQGCVKIPSGAVHASWAIVPDDRVEPSGPSLEETVVAAFVDRYRRSPTETEMARIRAFTSL